MSETSQADPFAERVDVTTQPDGAFIGKLEIEVPPATIRDVDHPRGDQRPAGPDRGARTREHGVAGTRCDARLTVVAVGDGDPFVEIVECPDWQSLVRELSLEPVIVCN